MAKSAQEVLLGLVSSAYKKDATGVAELQESEGQWKDNALDVMLGWDAERVTALKGPNIETRLDEKFKEGQRRAAEKMEQDLIGEFKLKQTDKKGIDLVRQIVADQVAAASKDGKLDDEGVKKHPLYLELERKVQGHDAAIEAAKDEVRKAAKAELDGERTAAQVREAARVQFRALNPVLAKTPAAAAQQEEDFLDLVLRDKFDPVVKDGKTELIPLKPDGKGRLEDNHGHAVSFNDHIKALAAARFDFKVGENKSAGPDPNDVGSGTGSGGSLKIASKADYLKEWARIEKDLHNDPKQVDAFDALKKAAKEAGVL